MIVDDCIGFEWDLGNFDKNHEKHNVSHTECEQVFFSKPMLLYDDEKHSQTEKRWYLLGKTDNERKLFVVFTVRNQLIRVISARDMSKHERRVYEKAQKDSEV